VCNSCGAGDLADQIEDALAMKDYGKGNDFLNSVMEYARDEGHVTERQREGVMNWIEPRKSSRW